MPSRQAPSYTGLRHEILDNVPLGARPVLNVGCAPWSLGQALELRQQAVVSIGVDEALARQAAIALAQVFRIDLDDWRPTDNDLPPASFDSRVCADVLEHLRDPWTVLTALCSLAREGASVIISLTDAGNLSMLQQIFLKVTFPRRPRGLHDANHLRSSARQDAAMPQARSDPSDEPI